MLADKGLDAVCTASAYRVFGESGKPAELLHKYQMDAGRHRRQDPRSIEIRSGASHAQVLLSSLPDAA
ncbi:MAG: hypothetical protein ACLTCB_04925 [Merdibacter sp.]